VGGERVGAARRVDASGRRDALTLAAEHAQTLHFLWRRRHAEPAALRAFQLRKLRVLVAHCRTRVAVYRDHWRDANLSSAKLDAPEALAALPTIGKDELRARPLAETLAAGTDARRLVRHLTSGTSGQPFAIHRSWREEHLLNQFRLRAYRDAGMRLFDRVALFMELPRDPAPRSWPGRVRQALRIQHEFPLDAMAPAERMFTALARTRPDVVAGYPTTLEAVAEWMDAHDPGRVRPRLVLSESEQLSEAARRRIESAFAAPVVDTYGTHEFNLVATQCPHTDAYHVCADGVLVEVIGDDGGEVPVGATGEVVATALHSYTMPFVRYRTGDLAVRGGDACACGLAGPTLRALQGRAMDMIRLPDGRSVHPFAITGYVSEREAAWVARMQLVRVGAGELRLDDEPRGTPRAGDLERLRAFGAGVLGAGVSFDVGVVDGFARAPGGKFQLYVPGPDAPIR
jgi:phenylacetate-CoA ligase